LKRRQFLARSVSTLGALTMGTALLAHPEPLLAALPEPAALETAPVAVASGMVFSDLLERGIRQVFFSNYGQADPVRWLQKQSYLRRTAGRRNPPKRRRL